METQIFVIDLFCGAGGTTTGFAQVPGVKVIACVNHDPKAIKSHWENHPEVIHFEEDIRTLNLSPLVFLVASYRKQYPNAKVILWASLECTNFSKAKGGQPRDADSRTLADHLDRYIDAIKPDAIPIENVVEFMSWGPMKIKAKKKHETYTDLCILTDKKTGKKSYGWEPISRKNGQDWMRWRKMICDYGYRDEWKEMNSADYGAYTSRNRLFGIFAKEDFPIVWPLPTHSKKPGKGGMFGDLKKWMPVKDVLDFNDEGESIFNRPKPLSDKTLERIYAGLIKYVAKGDKSFISKYYSGRPAGKVNSINDPASTVTTVGNMTLVQPEFLLKYNSTNGKTGKYVAPSVEDPCPVVSTQGRLGLVQPEFLAAYYGNGDNVSSVDQPCPTIPTKDRFGVVQPEFFLDKHYGSCSQNQSIDQPAGTIMPNDKHRLVETIPFVMPTNYDNKPTSIEDPSPTITANRKHHYIVNPSHGGHTTSIDAPCPVIIARQDKAPLYCVQVESGSVIVPVYEDDSESMIKIKQFMAAYSLVDIKMRMLRVHELLKIQGFPEGYKLEGNQADQKKFIGNSVVPQVVKAWAEVICSAISSKVQVA